MAHTYGGVILARASDLVNPITRTSAVVSAGMTVVVLLLKFATSADRAGGAPTLGGIAMIQANTSQKAAASPECGVEVWYLFVGTGPTEIKPGTYTLSVPNTNAQFLWTTLVAGNAAAGGRSRLLVATGNNATATNPSPGAAEIGAPGVIGFAIVASGAQTWAPSAQAGTAIANTDDGNNGGGEQYVLNPAIGAFTLGWTFGTSEDYGAVAAFFGEVPPNTLENYHDPKCVSAGVMSVGGIG